MSNEQIKIPSFIAIDPGSNSSGWSYWVDGKLILHGTVKVSGNNICTRLSDMNYEYVKLANGYKKLIDPELFVVEMMGRNTSHYAVWSIGAIIAAFSNTKCFTTTTKKLGTEVPITCWKKAWGLPLHAYEKDGEDFIRLVNLHFPDISVESEDEAVAILIGDFYAFYLKENSKLSGKEVVELFKSKRILGGRRRKRAKKYKRNKRVSNRR